MSKLEKRSPLLEVTIPPELQSDNDRNEFLAAGGEDVLMTLWPDLIGNLLQDPRIYESAEPVSEDVRSHPQLFFELTVSS